MIWIGGCVMDIGKVDLTGGDSVVKSDCYACGGLRNCKLKGAFAESGGDDDYSWHVDWQILQCQGCDAVFARTISTNSEDCDNFYEEDGSTGTIYNATVKHWPALMKRQFPEWMSDAGMDAENVDKLDDILSELYRSFNNDMYILAAIGMRTAFDVASNLLGISEALTFQQKIDALAANGKIGPRDKDRLISLVEAGNATAHRGWKPKAEELSAMMDALEYFIHESFILPHRKARTDERIASMDKRVPPKPKGAGKKTT